MALRRRSRHAENKAFLGFSDIEQIGVGGFSTVFGAREIETDRLVALKLLNAHNVSEHDLQSFGREMLALGTLSAHPNIATLYRTLTTDDGRPVLVLELYRGSISDQIHDHGPLPPEDSVAIAIKIAGALETAHQAGMLHRDIKPQNILTTQDGEPSLADFGVARLRSSSQSAAGVIGFATFHAAPELLEGREVSPATDVYELASTLYQLISGKTPFRSSEDEGPAPVILRILHEPVQPLLAADVPVALSDLLVRAMSKDPSDRPSSALEFAEELRSVEESQGWPDTIYTAEERVVTEHAAPLSVPTPPAAAPSVLLTPPDPAPPPPPIPVVAAPPLPVPPASSEPLPAPPPVPPVSPDPAPPAADPQAPAPPVSSEPPSVTSVPPVPLVLPPPPQAPAPIEPQDPQQPAPVEPASVPPAPPPGTSATDFDQLFEGDHDEHTVAAPTPAKGTAMVRPATWSRPRFLSQSFSLDDTPTRRNSAPPPAVNTQNEPAAPLFDKPLHNEPGSSEATLHPNTEQSDEHQPDEPPSTPTKNRRRHKRR